MQSLNICLKKRCRHSAGLQPYDSSPWDRLKKEKVFAEWPLKGYLAGIEKLQALTRAYWQARELLNSKKDQASKYLNADILQRWTEILSRTLKNHMLEAETKKLTALTNEMEEIRLRGSAAAVVRVPNPNFKPTEFDLATYTNSDIANISGITNTTSDPQIISNLENIHKAVQEIEVFLGRKIEINSGFRDTQLNKKVGGVPTSDHTLGYATDLDIPINENEHNKVMTWIREKMPKITQAIAYSHPNQKGFIHISIDPSNTNKTRLLKSPQKNVYEPF